MEKAVLVLIDSLRQIHLDFSQYVIHQRKTQKLKEGAEKIMNAVKARKSNDILGKDMCEFMRMMEKEDFFTNHKEIDQ